MTRHYLSFFIASIMMLGCGDPPPDFRTQDIGNAVWRTNDRMMIFAEKKNFAAQGAFEYKLYDANGSGEIGVALAEEMTTESVPPLYLSPDGNTAVFVLRGKLLKQDLTTGQRRQMTTNVIKLFAVSPDLKYALVTHAHPAADVKTVSLLDIAGISPRSVKEWDLRGLTVDQGYWVEGDRIAMTFDTTDNREFFVSLYDTTGALISSYGNVSTPARSSDYEPSTNSLFVKALDGALERIDLTTGGRTFIAENFTNMDVQGNALAYVVLDQSKQKLYIHNLTTGEEKVVADDVWRYAILSPGLDKVAYVRESHANYNEVKVIGIQVP